MPAVLLLVLATLFWAGNYVVGERVVGAVGPLSLTWLRWLLAALPLVLLAHRVDRPDWRAVLRRWPVLLLMSLLGVVGYPVLLYTALAHTSATNASIINAVNPALIVVGAALLGQSRPGWRTWAGVALGLVGVLLVLTRGDVARLRGLRFDVGDLWMLAAVTAWAAYTLIGRRLSLPPLASVAVQAALAALVLTPFALVAGPQLPGDGPTWGALLYIVLLPSIGSYLCWNLAVPRTSAGVAAASMNLVTVFTVTIAAVLGTPPTLVQLVGGALVIGGVLLTLGRSAPRKAPARA